MQRDTGIPIFYTEAVREPSGIDLLTTVHRILPKSLVAGFNGAEVTLKKPFAELGEYIRR